MNRTARAPDRRIPCPDCGPACRSSANRVRPVCGVWKRDDGSTATFCNRCGAKSSKRKPRLAEYPAPRSAKPARQSDRAELARSLWNRAVAIEGTPATTYLREARGLSKPLPTTLRYLPARGAHPHAMIAAFGYVGESAPGMLEAPDCIPAVHLTRLTPDGRKRLDKRMIGPVSGHPLVLAPPNDGLGLAIAEGIEDALSIHEATGLGAWAGGSAGHMAKLCPVVPDWIDCVTLIQDDDVAGRKACARLSSELFARGFEVRNVCVGGGGHGA
jgi:hypothetical protein